MFAKPVWLPDFHATHTTIHTHTHTYCTYTLFKRDRTTFNTSSENKKGVAFAYMCGSTCMTEMPPSCTKHLLPCLYKKANGQSK